MRLDVLLLASLPSSLGMQLAYSPPPALMAKVAAQDDCVLPGDYEVRDFAGKSNDTGSTLASFDFKFVDPATKVETACHFNETSVSGTPSALTPRYPCEHGEVEFIWEGNKTKLWMIERVCPGPDGKADFEVSGSLLLPVTCAPGGSCGTNSTLHTSKFTSVQPVRGSTI